VIRGVAAADDAKTPWFTLSGKREFKMKLTSATDKALCVALKHECLRCIDAFNDFAASATISVTQGENRMIAFKSYNAYARFILHLYEFMLGAIAREQGDTTLPRGKIADAHISSHARRILRKRREAILNGTAPVWENHISAYPEELPKEFAEAFRHCRNYASVHVSAKRSRFNLSEFYDKYHLFLYLLYYDVKGWWGRVENEFPDLDEITAFSILIKGNPPSQP